MPLIAMTREMGSLGKDVAAGIAERLGKPVVHHEIIDNLASKMRLRKSHVIRFLEAIGPAARFDVILFHTIPEIWQGQLVPADAPHVRDLREWLGLQVPNGGTRARPSPAAHTPSCLRSASR